MSAAPLLPTSLEGASRPLIAHIVFRLDYGGLENGLVNLINGLPHQEFRHCIIALTEASGFRDRIVQHDVAIYELKKKPGKDLGAYGRLYRLVQKLQPDVVHSRNIGTIDCTAVCALAGVPVRVHGEHGWDVHDPDGTSRRYLWMRRTFGLLINDFVTVSVELEKWLAERVGIPARKVRRICNGVDTERFVPRGGRLTLDGHPPLTPESVVVGSVTRFSDIKDPLNTLRAFLIARVELLARGVDLRLAMAGDGPLRATALGLLEASGHRDAAWLPGSRDDVPRLLSAMDFFVLGSRREGISNTVLEAMASGLPVIATRTGGNLELVQDGATGALVPVGDPQAMADAIVAYALSRELRLSQGAAARKRATCEYSLAKMLGDYRELYRSHCVQLGVLA